MLESSMCVCVCDDAKNWILFESIEEKEKLLNAVVALSFHFYTHLQMIAAYTEWTKSVGCIAISPHRRIPSYPSLPFLCVYFVFVHFIFVSLFSILYFCAVYLSVLMLIFRLLLIIISHCIEREYNRSHHRTKNEGTFIFRSIDCFVLCVSFPINRNPIVVAASCIGDAQFYRHFPCLTLSVHNLVSLFVYMLFFLLSSLSLLCSVYGTS